jgi:hypothetical protein
LVKVKEQHFGSFERGSLKCRPDFERDLEQGSDKEGGEIDFGGFHLRILGAPVFGSATRVGFSGFTKKGFAVSRKRVKVAYFGVGVKKFDRVQAVIGGDLWHFEPEVSEGGGEKWKIWNTDKRFEKARVVTGSDRVREQTEAKVVGWGKEGFREKDLGVGLDKVAERKFLLDDCWKQQPEQKRGWWWRGRDLIRAVISFLERRKKSERVFRRKKTTWGLEKPESYFIRVSRKPRKREKTFWKESWTIRPRIGWDGKSFVRKGKSSQFLGAKSRRTRTKCYAKWKK